MAGDSEPQTTPTPQQEQRAHIHMLIMSARLGLDFLMASRQLGFDPATSVECYQAKEIVKTAVGGIQEILSGATATRLSA